MSIFTSQKRNLQDLPKPAEFGSVKNIGLPEVNEEVGSVSNLPEREVKAKKQVFVKMDQYKEALNTINKIRDKMKDADMVLNDLRNMKAKEDEHLIKWHNDLEEIKKRLNEIKLSWEWN